jgi:hypothetical protein
MFLIVKVINVSQIQNLKAQFHVAGWKYYLLNSPVHLFTVISIQGVAGI